MKEELYKLVDAVVAGDDETASTAFSAYLTSKTTSLMQEQQNQLFADPKQDKPSKRYLVKPTGMSYDDKRHAIESTKNHPGKTMDVIDTETDEVVYSTKKTKKE